MQAIETQYSSSRKHARHAVEWTAARMEVGVSSCINGTIRDHSEGGVCFEPEVAYLDGKFLLRAEVVDYLEPGEAVQIVMITDKGPRCVECLVRWTGVSQRHDCPAIGLEFIMDETPIVH